MTTTTTMTTQEARQLNNTVTDKELYNKLYEREIASCVDAGAGEGRLREDGYDVYQLEQIRRGLTARLDVSVYMHPQYSWIDMEEIRKGLEQGIDMKSYRDRGYATEQKREIREGIAAGLDVSQYDHQEYLAGQMREIRLGLADGLPVVFYNNPAYDENQMQEIRLGLKQNFDISVYADPSVPYTKMRVIRRSMEDGLSFSEQEIASYDVAILEQIHKAHLANVDIRPFVEEGYDAIQLEQIRISLEKKLKFKRYIRRDMLGECLKEIRLGLEAGVDVKHYAGMEYRWRQMREIRLGLEARVNTGKYRNPLYEAAQMREIRLGLEKGLDVSRYTSMMYTARDMERIREELMRGVQETRVPYRPAELPAVWGDPVLPFEERPDPRLLREALEKEQQVTAARRAGHEIYRTDEEEAADAAQLQALIGSYDGTADKKRRGAAAAIRAKKEKEEAAAPVNMHGQTVVVSDDKMICYLSLPAPAGGKDYTEELVYAILKKSHVVKGIDGALVKSIIRDRRYKEQFVVARGEKPVNGNDGRYEYYFDRRSATMPDLDDDGSADFSRCRFFSEVKAGDVIATYIHAEKGTDGYTVTGETLPARNGVEKPVLKGKGFLLMSDRVSYAAALSGVARTDGYELNVSRLLTLETDVVDVNSKIEFLGSVWVKCNMMPGTRIEAQGDVIVESVAESLHIKAGGDVVMKEGATGRTRGSVEAHGTVSGKYIANYDIRTHGGVFANSFLHCNVETDEKLVCFGDNGTVFGGSIKPKLGLECAVIGTETFVPTAITLGITSKMLADYGEAEKNVERILDEIKSLAGNLEKLSALPATTKEIMQAKIKMSAALNAKKKEYEEAATERERVVEYINSIAGAESLVSSIIYEGTTFFVDEAEIKIADTKYATEEKPIVIKGKAKQWKQLQQKSSAS